MNRRRFTSLLGTSAAFLAGCVRVSPTSESTRSTPRSAADPASLAQEELPIPRSEMQQALPQDSIAAITDPAFDTDWSDVSVTDGAPIDLDPAEPVIGVERGGSARAYPLRVLRRHEVVNDVFDGPLLVSYCPLCGSSIVAERLVEGEPAVFGVSGLLWRGDLVMYDRASRTLWSQLLARAINGPLLGTRLQLVPSSLTSLTEWRRQHEDTAVLLPPPISGLINDTTAELEQYRAGYDGDRDSLIGFDGGGSHGISRATLVVGVRHDGVARAYPFPAVREAGVVKDRVANLPVVVTTTPSGSLGAYRRTINGRTLEFAAAGERHLRADGSRWERATGRAVDGPYDGRQLAAANALPPMFWTGWSSFHPDTTIYGQGTTPTED